VQHQLERQAKRLKADQRGDRQPSGQARAGPRERECQGEEVARGHEEERARR
jgi:hypothetical protein